MALAAFDLRADSTLAVPRRLELGDKTRLLVFVKRARDLPHHLPGRIAAVCQVVAVSGQHTHATLDERHDAKLLRHQLAGEAGGVLDDDSANAVVLDAVE